MINSDNDRIFNHRGPVMMKETKNVRQINEEPRRRWFWSDFFDLIVWLSDEDEVVGFQLCYDIRSNQRGLTWEKETGYSHEKVDAGEDKPGRYKGSPILVADGIFEEKRIAALFKDESKNIDKQIVDFVHVKILEYEVKRI